MGLFGLGDGKMELKLASENAVPGKSLEGTATLTLNKDVRGKEVVAILYAEKTVVNRTQNGQVVNRKVNMYEKSETLDTEKLYTKADGPYQYKFSFIIPEFDPGAKLGGTAGTIENLVAGAFASRNAASLIRWYVKVELKHEAMLSFPIEKKQEINIVKE